MNQKSLAHYCGIFFSKTGGLAEDMSQRIMYSILPHLADPAQIALTNGVVDYRALKTAVEGRTKLIQYGVKAVLDELGNALDNDHSYNLVGKLLHAAQYGKAMDVAIETFANDDLWETSFGGKAWEEIAKTLRQLIRLDRTLNGIKAQPVKDQEKELQVMRDIVVMMNVFDGLAHNSSDVMGNLINFEKKDSELNEPFRDKYNKIRRIMDAKELESPAEVYKMIEPTLKDSGDINKFKDWVSKMRRSEEFRKNDESVPSKLFMIYLRKGLIYARGRLNHIRDVEIGKRFNDLKARWSWVDYLVLHDRLSNVIGEIDIAVKEFPEHIDNFIKQYPEFAGMKKQFESIIHPYQTKASNIYNQLVKAYNNELDPDVLHKGDAEKAMKKLSEAVTLINSFSYLIDSI